MSCSSIKFPKLKLQECMKDREENSNEIFRVKGYDKITMQFLLTSKSTLSVFFPLFVANCA